MLSELTFRIIGMIIFALLGARFGVDLASPPLNQNVFALIFGLVGALSGLILTPYFTTRPARFIQRIIRQMPAEVILTSVLGLIIGLIIGALMAVPFTQLPDPLGQWSPSIAALAAAYIFITLFAFRTQDIFRLFREILRINNDVQASKPTTIAATVALEQQILLDTSVIIDGRVLDISKTGFITGSLLVPQFVLTELQHIADSADVLRRTRGRRGLEILESLRTESKTPITIIDHDVEGIREVDHKLVALAKQLNAQLMTNDYNLNRVADLQGVGVLNINELANAVKAVFLPNEVIIVQIIAEGKEHNQGVGYLDDGTMVVVEDGKRFMDRTLDVVITRMIQTAAGKMYFARPEDSTRK